MIRFYLFSTILRKPKIPSIQIQPLYTTKFSLSTTIVLNVRTLHINIDCEQCGRGKHTFWDDPVGDLFTYLCKSRPCCNKIVAIAHNAKAFDLHFILNRAIFLKWKPKLIVNGLKIICMTMEHLTFIDSISFMPCSQRKLPETFGLTGAKSWYPHYFNTKENELCWRNSRWLVLWCERNECKGEGRDSRMV